ncbi:MAG: alpha/beta hydrolase [Geminocystis sp.]|nr:alpha/beta hydrolase [Geminocystis sp.]HIK36399.1 alpha/beta hydrolase [Geminocystis sp. M7585_C2015_104]MCS7147994.1 alpha/beta hydrolase [Geminocystis sp.]MCX8078969.1 alpha/beta hydrolase [Geminocystis sp.]MDW8116926.1 alpha/beta hydrolase [Geminocystis sp.]
MSFSSQKGLVNLRGVNHYYEWVGYSDSFPSKPVMVFLHGWGGSCRYWRSIAELLAPDYDCLLYDLRGFGRSRENNRVAIGYELEDYAEDLYLLLEAFNLDKVYLHAHSMGASIALTFLTIVPERVQKAILVCNGVYTYNPLTFNLFYRASISVIKSRGQWLLKIPFADRIFMSRFLHKPIPKPMYSCFLEDFLLAEEKAAINTIFSSVNQKNVEIMPRRFAQISIPTLMISGEKDRIIPASLAKKAVALNKKNIVYHEIPNTGHFPMLEAPNQYLDVVENFLNASPS